MNSDMKTVTGKMMLAGALLLAGVTGIRAAEHPVLQRATVGSIERHYVYSPQMGDTITVDVWLPEGYVADGPRRYPVIYMHDGQNLFDASTSWNRQSWEMDSVAGTLSAAGEIEAPVIVGVHSVAATRKGDLMPGKAIGRIDPGEVTSMKNLLHGNEIRGNRYVAFIVETLKPMVDSVYTVATDRDNTSVMGSSMGGLMSVYALCEYPGVFGSAACLSTHWIGSLDGNPAFPVAMRSYLADNLPADGLHRLYFDHGTVSLDSLYGVWEERMIELVESRGYRRGETLDTFVAVGAGHEERFWRDRVERPLRFLLAPRRSSEREYGESSVKP